MAAEGEGGGGVESGIYAGMGYLSSSHNLGMCRGGGWGGGGGGVKAKVRSYPFLSSPKEIECYVALTTVKPL
jgi:hypothetical protein